MSRAIRAIPLGFVLSASVAGTGLAQTPAECRIYVQNQQATQCRLALDERGERACFCDGSLAVPGVTGSLRALDPEVMGSIGTDAPFGPNAIGVQPSPTVPSGIRTPANSTLYGVGGGLGGMQPGTTGGEIAGDEGAGQDGALVIENAGSGGNGTAAGNGGSGTVVRAGGSAVVGDGVAGGSGGAAIDRETGGMAEPHGGATVGGNGTSGGDVDVSGSISGGAGGGGHVGSGGAAGGVGTDVGGTAEVGLGNPGNTRGVGRAGESPGRAGGFVDDSDPGGNGERGRGDRDK